MVWKRFYLAESFLDKGTMCQLRNAINRANVSAASVDDFNACEDFFLLVVRCHVATAAMQYLNMKYTSDNPVHPQLKDDLWLDSLEKRSDILQSISKEITLIYVDLEMKPGSLSVECDDKVQCYAAELLSLGLMYMEFSDSIREGDGLRIIRCWRYLMLIFKATQRKCYSIEAFNLLCQYHFFFSERQAQQLLWSRCVNTHGLSGRNIPADLFMEHLNRLCKIAVANLGPNKTPNGLLRAGRSAGGLAKVIAKYDKDFRVSESSGKHATASMDKDKSIILKQLLEAAVFSKH